MSGEADVTATLQGLSKQLQKLVAKDEIRDCLYRINRGMDRIDRELMLSGFHAGAQVCWASPDYVPLNAFIEVAMRVQATTSRVQHLLGNILIDLNSDEADVESYEIARHLTPLNAGERDLIIASRYVDKFCRREGAWRIDRRLKIIDWIRIMEGGDPMWETVHVKGARDATDHSCQMFGRHAFKGEKS